MLESVIKFGIERNETTLFRVPAKAIWTLERQHKVVTRYTLFDNRTVKVVREVKPGRPNWLVVTATVQDVRATKLYQRL